MNSANEQHGSISSSGLKAPAWVLALGLILATFIVAGLMIYLAVNDKQWSWRLDSFGVIQQEANPEDVKQFCEEQENNTNEDGHYIDVAMQAALEKKNRCQKAATILEYFKSLNHSQHFEHLSSDSNASVQYMKKFATVAESLNQFKNSEAHFKKLMLLHTDMPKYYEKWERESFETAYMKCFEAELTYARLSLSNTKYKECP